MRRCSCCSPSRSDLAPVGRRRVLRWLWPAVLAVALGLVAAVLPVPEAAAAGSTVTGSIGVWQATLRTEGPKHDLDVVVHLEPAGGGAPPPPAAARVEMDQKGLVFLPHVLAIQKGTTVTFLNSDREQHNVYFLDDRTGDTLDIGTWGPGVSVDHTFEEPGTVITLCKLHLEMAAYIVVVGGPWFTTARLDPQTFSGTFEIGGVPPGEYDLVVWHKKLRQRGGATRITVTEGGTTGAEVVITKAKYAKGW